MAQVYSQNAVGYINIPIKTGFNLIANQLIAPSYTLSALMPAPVPGTTVYKYSNVSGYSASTYDELDLVWLPNGNMTIDLGGGVFVFSPGNTTLTLVGEVPQGTLNTPVPHGFSIASSQVPQQATISTVLGYVPSPGDTVYKYANPGGYSAATFDELDLVWFPGEPTVGVGEAVFINRAGSAGTWTRIFSVN
jgi:hypothetical protein